MCFRRSLRAFVDEHRITSFDQCTDGINVVFEPSTPKRTRRACISGGGCPQPPRGWCEWGCGVFSRSSVVRWVLFGKWNLTMLPETPEAPLPLPPTPYFPMCNPSHMWRAYCARGLRVFSGDCLNGYIVFWWTREFWWLILFYIILKIFIYLFYCNLLLSKILFILGYWSNKTDKNNSKIIHFNGVLILIFGNQS